MADPFNPKFVDLVKNFTTTQGTGPITLGAAVSGFAGLAATLVAGDQFYYCMQGIDKPAEREVGRGMLQANGTVARSPVSGALVNFTSGTKTIALVTAAEWFSRINQMPAPPPALDVATRTELAALSAQNRAARLLKELGREGIFLFDSSNLSAKVAADPARAVYVAPVSDPSGASGAWVRDYEALRPEWFGAVGDGVTDDTAAFAAMRTLCLALRSNETIGPRTAPPVRLSRKTYFLASSFDWKGCTNVWRGVGSGINQFPTGSIIRMASGATFYFDSNTTEGGGIGTAISNLACIGTEFHNIAFVGPGKGVGSASLVRLQTRVQFHNCIFTQAGGHGLAIVATAGGGGSTEGNANGWLMVGGACSNNGGSGLYTNGADANAGTAVAVSFDNNGRYGTEEESFLGNRYTGCHWDANTLGHLRSTNPNNTSTYDNYFESGYPVSTISPRSRAEGTNAALQVNGATFGAADAVGSGTGIPCLNGVQSYKVAGSKTLNIVRGARPDSYPAIDEAYFTDFCSGGTPLVQGFRVGADVYEWRVGAGGQQFLAVNGNGAGGLPRFQHGLSAAPGGALGLSAIYLGDGTYPDGRRFVTGSAAPASGEHAAGERVFNNGSVTSCNLVDYWLCIATGTPGTWIAVRPGHSPVTSQAGTAYTAAAADADSYLRFTSSAAVTFTVPANSAVAFPLGTVIELEQAGTGALTVAAAAGVTVSSRGADMTLAGQYAVAAVKKVATDSWTLTGDL